MPPIVATIVAIVQLAAQAGPSAKQIYTEAKKLIDWLFNGGLITVAQQQELKDWAELHEAAALAGEVPPELVVESNPV